MGDKHQTFLFLWSRTPTISDKAVEIYNEFVEKYSLDASVVLHVKQEDCGVAA
jgi:lipocalin